MKKKYTQKRTSLLNRRRGIFINNNKLKNKMIITTKESVNNFNKLLIIGIIAKRNKILTQEQINSIKQDLNNPQYTQRSWGGKISKYFEIKIKIKPNKIITKKGILVRMGRGKGKIQTKAINIIKNMVCIELKQKDKKNKKILNIKGILINNIFKKFLKKYTFLTLISNLTI